MSRENPSSERFTAPPRSAIDQLRREHQLCAVVEFERELARTGRIKDVDALPLARWGWLLRLIGASVLGCFAALLSLMTIFLIANFMLHLGA